MSAHTLLRHNAFRNRGFRGLAGMGRMGDANSPAPPDLNNLGWTDAQKIAASSLVNAVGSAPPFIDQNISLFQPPTDSLPFVVTTPVYKMYPPAGAPAISILTYTAPVGVMAVMNKYAILHYGGNDPSGTGNVTWSVTINGAGVAGLGQINYQIGTQSALNDIVLLLSENDVLQVLVQVNTNPQVGSTTAIFHGWKYPMSRATLPSPSQV